MAERLDLALAQYLGPLCNQAEDETFFMYVLFQNRAAAATLDSSHVLEIHCLHCL